MFDNNNIENYISDIDNNFNEKVLFYKAPALSFFVWK